MGRAWEVRAIIVMKKAANSQLRKIRELLKDKKTREEEGLFVAEGLRIVSDILQKGHGISSIYLSSGVVASPGVRKLQEAAEELKKDIFRIHASEFEKLSSLRNSQGVLAIVEMPKEKKADFCAEAGSLLVLCDGVQDPGNIGAMIRTAAAFGASGVLLVGATADIYNPKVIRASSGMILDVPVCKCSIEEVDRLKESGYILLASSIMGEGSKDISKLKVWDKPVIIAFGSEGKGLSRGISAAADEFFHIPMRKNVDSLNVAAAATIALYVFTHKREQEG